MTLSVKNSSRTEFGDFQTPLELAQEACAVLKGLGVKPAAIVEPTCGIGNFLIAGMAAFPAAETVVGVDINAEYIAATRHKLERAAGARKVDLRCASFFEMQWSQLLATLPDPILVLGNPPWVTNAGLGAIGSDNLPAKTNFQSHAGFDAITGKSNFDISEWMIVRLIEWLQRRPAVLAMLCKTAVARKALHQAWKKGIPLESSALYRIDAAESFGAAVDACFLVCWMNGQSASWDCRVFESIEDSEPSHAFGFREEQLIADVKAYEACKHLQGVERYKWRSGIKHDCSSVMELRRFGDEFENGLGHRAKLEAEYLYPMFKSSEVAAGNVASTNRYMLVPQKSIGSDTDILESEAPRTWAYLQEHAALLDRRGSSIYRKRPRFSVFGVGPYSFLPWKVAVSGFYKSLNFRVVGPIDDRPVVFDDTCNFISCETEDEAQCMADLLTSAVAANCFKAFVFWDAKRPLTVDLLRRLDLLHLAGELKCLPRAEPFIHRVAGTEKKSKRYKKPESSSLFE